MPPNKRDLVISLSGWLRSNIANVVNEQILRALAQETSDPRTMYFNELMVELESLVCERKACFCRVPQLRNDAAKNLRAMYARKQDCPRHSEAPLPFEDKVIADEMVETMIQTAKQVLAKREFEVFALLIAEKSYQEVADQLGIAVGTVGATKDRIKKKLRTILL